METDRKAVKSWPATLRMLHWGMAIAIAAEVIVGFTMALTFLGAMQGGKVAQLHLRAGQVHHTLGFFLLAAVVWRLVVRLRHAAPADPDLGVGARIAARAVQGLLYLLMLLLPLSGWAALSALGAGAGYEAPSIWFFTHDGFAPGGMIPHLVVPRPWNAPGLLVYSTFAKFHVYAVYTGAVLLSVHIGAALYHHFWRRDRVLARMAGRD